MKSLPKFRQAARRSIRAAIAAGASRYDRSALPGLVPIVLAELPEGPDGARLVLRKLERALRSERARAGHWTYDLNRHIGLAQAHAAELTRLAAETRSAKK
jgi:hypothetical protein